MENNITEQEEQCLCMRDYTDDICIMQNETGQYELQFWDWYTYDEDGYTEENYTMGNSIEINYCPFCGKKL